MKTNGIRSNRQTLNKSVLKKPIVSHVSLTFYQYENILCSNMTSARICNILKIHLLKDYIQKLRQNKIPEYSNWYKEVRKKKSSYAYTRKSQFR